MRSLKVLVLALSMVVGSAAHAAKPKAAEKTAAAPGAKAAAVSGVFAIPLKTLSGQAATLAPYQGKVLLIVNTASECGFTPQYKGLQALQDKYAAKGFTVLGFPSNDFGEQEPGSPEQIKNFCERNYGVKFPLFAKGPVSGENKQPIYDWLLKNSESAREVRWNFEKFLLGRDGKVIDRWRSMADPEGGDIEKAIQRALAAQAP